MTKKQPRVAFATFLAIAAIATACMPATLTPISRRKGPFVAKTPGYSYQGDVVSYEGKPIIRIVQTDLGTLETYYEIRPEGAANAEVSIIFASSYNNTLECRADFPTLGVHYEVRIPIVPFTDLLASYIDNKVLVAGHVDRAGLQAYTESKGIALIDTAAQSRRLQVAGDRARCRNCSQDFRRCQVNESYERQHPPPGVSFARSCETEFQQCSQGGMLRERDKWPCGGPPN